MATWLHLIDTIWSPRKGYLPTSSFEIWAAKVEPFTPTNSPYQACVIKISFITTTHKNAYLPRNKRKPLLRCEQAETIILRMKIPVEWATSEMRPYGTQGIFSMGEVLCDVGEPETSHILSKISHRVILQIILRVNIAYHLSHTVLWLCTLAVLPASGRRIKSGPSRCAQSTPVTRT